MSRYSATYAKKTGRVLSVEDKEERFALNYEKSYPYRKEGDIRYFNLLTPDQSVDLEAEFFNFSEEFSNETVGWNYADFVKRKKSEGCRRIVISPNPKFKTKKLINKIIDMFLYYDEITISNLRIKYRIVIFNDTQRVKVYE
ncbi:MAG: hypothetical protein AAGH74_04350 [Pseudomonadota bacterium]